MKGLTKYQELNQMISSFDEYKGIIGVGELSGITTGCGERESEEDEIRFPDALFILYGMEGSAKIHLDYTPYEISSNSFVIVLPIHVLQIVKISPDFKGRILVVQKSFAEECNCANSYLSVSNYMILRKNPSLAFQPGETIYLDKCLRDILEKIRLESHAFHKEVIQNAFCAYTLELAHRMNQQRSLSKPKLSRKEEIVNKFFQLIMSYCKVEHTTGFYAGKLCITPQYLSSILKTMTGKPANQWIADALITEAKIQLRQPQVTVQEVAYSLNFSDQSSFGKFFKKGIGVSPSQYRVGAVG